MTRNLSGLISQSCAMLIEKSDKLGNNMKTRKNQFYFDAFGWGFVLWFFGYLLSMVLFFIVPVDMLGWVILPVGTIITFWVLLKKIKGNSFDFYLKLSIIWTLIAIVCDYLFLVNVLNPADGYYKLDVYLYYALTFILPLAAYWHKSTNNKI